MEYQAAVDALAPLAGVAKPALADVLVTALARLGLGGALHELGRGDDAGRALDDAARPLAGRADNNSRFIIAAVRNRQGEILAGNPERLADAERSYDEAVDLAAALVSEFREQANYQLLLATALNGRGGVRIALGPGRATEAEADCRRALEVLEAAAPKFADDPTYHSQLGLTLDHLARLARDRDATQMGSFRERARKAHEKARALNPDRPVFQRRLDEHRKQAGD
ncbi:MAG: hypothetical protein U0835_23855 [Isosphaeraceae bacterium]